MMLIPLKQGDAPEKKQKMDKGKGNACHGQQEVGFGGQLFDSLQRRAAAACQEVDEKAPRHCKFKQVGVPIQSGRMYKRKTQ